MTINTLFNNIIPMACIYGAFAMVNFMNIVLGTCNNCLINNEKFEGRRILISFLKLLLVAFVTTSVVVGFNLLQFGAAQYDISISDTVIQVINVGMFLMLYATAFGQTCTDIYNKIKSMFEIKLPDIEYPTGLDDDGE